MNPLVLILICLIGHYQCTQLLSLDLQLLNNIKSNRVFERRNLFGQEDRSANAVSGDCTMVFDALFMTICK